MLTGLAERFRRALGPSAVVTDPTELRSYVCPGAGPGPAVPGLVVLPSSTDEVVEVVRVAGHAGVPVVGHGRVQYDERVRSAVPEPVLLVSTRRMRRILEIDILNQRVVVEPGADSGAVSHTVRPCGYEYLPDPFGDFPGTVGDLVAECPAGAGARHVTGLEVVTPDGEVVWLGGGKAPEMPGYDLLGLYLGSEGTLGVTTRVVARLRREPQSRRVLLAHFGGTDAFPAIATALDAAGIVPARIGEVDSLPAVPGERPVGIFPAPVPGFPGRATAPEAALYVELVGPVSEVETELTEVIRICRRAGAYDLRVVGTTDRAPRVTPLRTAPGRRSAPPPPRSVTGPNLDTHELVRRAFRPTAPEPGQPATAYPVHSALRSG